MGDIAGVYARLAQGLLDEAAALLEPLLLQHPDDGQLHRARAVLAQSRGHADEALDALRAATRLAPEAFPFWLERGQLAALRGHGGEAVQAFEQATRLQPASPDAWYLLGMSLCGLRRHGDALAAFSKADALAPGQPLLLYALADTHLAMERHAEALALYERLVADGHGTDPALYLRRARCLRRTGSVRPALAVVEAGVAHFPGDAELWLERGGLHEDLGDEESACVAYGRAQALRPRWGDPVACQIALLRERTPEALVQTAQAWVTGGMLPDGEQAYLHYVLGKREDARAAYAMAATHWDAANGLRRRIDGAFDRAAYAEGIERTITAFDAAMLRAHGRQQETAESPAPVFVLGVPRSGTTLVEQVLAAHPRVHGAGELTELDAIARSLSGQAGMRWPEDASRMEPDAWRDLARRYRREAVAQAPAGTLWCVDKQPYNVPHVGLMAMLLPGAHVVWCRRDPRDVALSMYSESFAPSSRHATDLDDIRYFIEGQERLMRHWRAVSPLPLLEVRYEDLVADIEAGARRLLAFLGLPWDARCLAFHAVDRPVQTLSRWQVRQPVHARSVGRWRHYPMWFGREA